MGEEASGGAEVKSRVVEYQTFSSDFIDNRVDLDRGQPKSQ